MKRHALAPLQQAFALVNSWLLRDGVSRILIAYPTISQLQQQNLPEHVRVTPKKRRGARHTVRGRRHYNEAHFKLAHWPDDALDENVLPSIACVIRGEADLNIADYVLHCRAGDWVLFPAGVPKQDGSKPHFEGDPTGRECDLLWLAPGLGLQCWICRSVGEWHGMRQGAGSNCTIRHQFLLQLFQGFCDEMQNQRRPELVTYFLRGVLLLAASEIEAGHSVYGWHGKEAALASEMQEPIEVALKYIEENLHQRLTIQTVAQRVLVSPATLTRRFRERTGQSFIAYLNGQRLQQASDLLLKTDLPLEEVCAHVGLKYGQLRNLFLQNYGCSPGEYREREK
jgi:AraC-type DNA-binding domain-containing proteins